MAADMSKMTCGGAGSLLCGSGPGADECSLGSGGGASSLRRLSAGNGGGGGGTQEASASDDTPGSPMATDRRVSGGSACSPQVNSDNLMAFNLNGRKVLFEN